MAETREYPRLVRPREGRILAGVCTGLGRQVGVDPVVLRVAFAVLVLANGQGILLYVVGYLLMPPAHGKPSKIERLLRRRFDADTVLALLGGLLGLGLLIALVSKGMTGDSLAVVAVFALVLLVAHARNVKFVELARTMPERVQGHQPPRPDDGPVELRKETEVPLPEGMIDLATLSRPVVPEPPAPVAPKPRRPRRESAKVTRLTLLGALAVAGAMIPVATSGYTGTYGSQVVMASALAVVGLGLLAGGWTGRTRGLGAVGTVLTLSLLTTTAVAETPPDTRFGGVEWRPTDASQSEQTYRLGVGDARLDLTVLRLSPGQRIRISAYVTAGELKVTVPAAARVEFDGRIWLGDLTVDGRINSGPQAKVTQVLEPETRSAADPPVIELRVRARIGDVEVFRG